MMKTTLRVLMLAFLVGCARSKVPAPKGAVFEVFRGKRQVLIVRNEPGLLTSTVELGRGESWPRHPFLSADATAPEEEGKLGNLLRRSTSFDDFLSRLQAAGYELKKRA